MLGHKFWQFWTNTEMIIVSLTSQIYVMTRWIEHCWAQTSGVGRSTRFSVPHPPNQHHHYWDHNCHFLLPVKLCLRYILSECATLWRGGNSAVQWNSFLFDAIDTCLCEIHYCEIHLDLHYNEIRNVMEISATQSKSVQYNCFYNSFQYSSMKCGWMK